MPKIEVDGVKIELPQGAAVVQACEMAGNEVPRFSERIVEKQGQQLEAAE